MAKLNFLLLFLISKSIRATAAIDFAELIPHNLHARSPAPGGGWGLSALSCPSDAPACGATWCCPSLLSCVHTGAGVSANLCCPGTTACESAMKATPFCADDSWALWNQTNLAAGDGFFCCAAGQIGTQAGECVASDTVVAATLSAVLIASATGSAQPPSAATSSPAAGRSSTAASKSSPSKTTSAAKGTDTPADTTSSNTDSTETADAGGSPTPSTEPSSGNSHTLSTGAAAGIGVGATLIGLGIVAAIVFCLLRRRVRRNSSADSRGREVVMDPTNADTAEVVEEKKIPEVTREPVSVPSTHEVDGRAMIFEASDAQPERVHEMHG